MASGTACYTCAQCWTRPSVADELIKFNPLDRVNLSKLVPPDKRNSDFEPDPFTAAKLVTLLGTIEDPHERLAFQLGAFTSVRTGELIGLRWARVDLAEGAVFIKETAT